MPNNYQHLDPLYFSLPTTFNISRLARSDFMNTGSGCQVSPRQHYGVSAVEDLEVFGVGAWVLDPPLHLLRQLAHL